MLGSVQPYDGGGVGDKCIYRLHLWLCTQCYIISRPAMARWRDLRYIVGVTLPIDFLLSTYYDNDSFFTVRPMVGFQRHHAAVRGQLGTHETGVRAV